MVLETLKITELGLEFYVLEKVAPQMGKSLIYMVARAGIKPATQGFSVRHLYFKCLILHNFISAVNHCKWRTMAYSVVPNYANFTQGVLDALFDSTL
jgi:hypothetical protein